VGAADVTVHLLQRAEAKPRSRWFPGVGGHRRASWLLGVFGLVVLFDASVIWTWLAHRVGGDVVTYQFSMAASIVVFALLLGRGHFRVQMMSESKSQISSMMTSVATGGCAVMVVVSLLPVHRPTIEAVTGLFGSLLVGGLMAQLIGNRLLRSQWAVGNARASALIYGADELARELAVETDLRKDLGIDVVGVIAAGSDSVGEVLPTRVYDVHTDVLEIIERSNADVLIVGPGPTASDGDAIRLVRRVATTGMPIFIVPRFFEMGLGADIFAPDQARGYPLVRLQRSAHPQVSVRLKRLLDIAVSVLVLSFAWPLMALAAMAIKATSRGPVLFSQKRIGQHGKPILIRKFRSMTTSVTSDTEWTADQRVTRVGRLLRRTNIDELPQLYSVFKGDMSLVGPRPERPAFVDRFRREIPDYDYRHRMPVGITGLAQITGLRGDTPITERVKYDNLYIDQWSFRSDIHIILQTAVAVLRQSTSAEQVIELAEAFEAAAPAGESARSNGHGDATVEGDAQPSPAVSAAAAASVAS